MSIKEISNSTILNTFPVDQLPLEVLDRVLWFLPPKDLGLASCVSKVWNELATRPGQWQAFDLRKYFPKDRVKIFLKEDWIYYFGYKVEGSEPDIRKAFADITEKLASGKECTFYLKPAGISIRKLKEFGEKPLQGNPIQEVWIHPDILNNPIVDETSLESEYILSDNTVLEESRGKIFKDQEVEALKYLECAIADHIETLALPIIVYVSSGERKTRLLSDNPLRYARFPQKVQRYHLVVGDFAPALLNVCYDAGSFLFGNVNYGVLLVRKFWPLRLGELAIGKGH